MNKDDQDHQITEIFDGHTLQNLSEQIGIVFIIKRGVATQ